ncbi:MAG TPA: helicase-related protein, partial [Petrotogaceae bacterium]|nr:helicase-related protein [Petrotogaceae bacterium]
METADQEKAIEQIERDLSSEKTMDRLLVGDAGFGKTEVAMRAAFKTVLSDYQVLMLAPTTILAKQHFDSFYERMNEFGVRIELLDRYKTQREKEEVYKQVRDGVVDIVIGTHALFSKKLIFKKLGLVIIDEEQRFGVLQKERFKSISEGVNFLLMSATPIPRTLYMSVSGLRDISTISTPPIGRLPVQTFVGNYSERIVRTAVLREKLRGGQILYVHNRVQDIDKIYKKLKETIPEVSISCAHGRMKKSDFSRILQEFYSGKLDMLVATTIVENGIDIPNVNTLIVDDSQRYGISQLYQIKGRVGRSNKRAFAYFMHTSSALNNDARKRLEAIKEFNEPGSGLRLALRDLEIRGYGDILGLDQKGHINSVGLQLYKSILDRVLSQLYNDKDVVRDSDF